MFGGEILSGCLDSVMLAVMTYVICGAVLALYVKQVGGTIFHSFKGARNAPRGERFVGAIEAVKANARRLGGSFAVWGGLFSTFDCCLIAIRNKEDPYNSIVSPAP